MEKHNQTVIAQSPSSSSISLFSYIGDMIQSKPVLTKHVVFSLTAMPLVKRSKVISMQCFQVRYQITFQCA